MRLFGKEINKDKFLYSGLIFTFILLYGITAFVSFYHAITFFNIANAVWLSVLLSFVAEIGQASVLFAILLTDNKHKFLPWAVMVILTSLQVIGNVVSSYDWIIAHNGDGVESFQKSILFWMTAADPEIFKVVIAWISGALLPIIALSMTALVAQNMELRAHDARTNLDTAEDGKTDLLETTDVIETAEEEKPEETNIEPSSTEQLVNNIDAKDLIGEISKVRPTKDFFEQLQHFLESKKLKTKEEIIEEIKSEEKENDIAVKASDIPSQEKNGDIVNFDEPEEDHEPDDDELPVTSVEEKENIEILPDIEILSNNGIVEGVEIHPVEPEVNPKLDETPPIIETEKKIQETPVPTKSQDHTQHLTPEQLERIRQIAKDNLKKK